MKKTLSALAATASLLALAVPAGAANQTVKVDDDVFRAKTVTINKGNTVTWRWVGSSPHNVRFGSSGSTTKVTGVYKRRFTTRGTFKYRCTLHLPEMVGRVIVR